MHVTINQLSAVTEAYFAQGEGEAMHLSKSAITVLHGMKPGRQYTKDDIDEVFGKEINACHINRLLGMGLIFIPRSIGRKRLYQKSDWTPS